MKKFLSLIMMLIIILTCFASCAVIGSDADIGSGEVSLIGVESDTKAPDKKTVQVNANDSRKLAPKKLVNKPFMDDVEMTTETVAEDPISIGSEYVVIYKDQTTIYFTIKLSNPKNYYIMDFKLTCKDEDILVRQGSHLSSINDPDTYIRWDEAYDRVGNKTATFELVLPNKDVSPSTIKISEMYYSVREDGIGKSVVNMNNKENYSIYKIDEPMEFAERKNTMSDFSFKLNMTKDTTELFVKLDDEMVLPDENGVYHLSHDGKLAISYKLNLSETVVEVHTYEEEIKLLKIQRLTKENYKDYVIEDDYYAIEAIEKKFGEGLNYADVCYDIDGMDYSSFYIMLQFEGTDFDLETLRKENPNIEVISIVNKDILRYPIGIIVKDEYIIDGNQYKITICSIEYTRAQINEIWTGLSK